MPRVNRSTVKLTGRALKAAKRGDLVEIEIDLGIENPEFVTALPNEPPDVALVRLERENELMEQLNAAALRADREARRATILEQQLRGEVFTTSEFTERLADDIAGKLFERIVQRLQGWES